MHPILINFKFPIYSYGAMVALAFFVGLALIVQRAKKVGISREFISDLFLVILICGIVGARVLYVIINWTFFSHDPLEIVMIHHGGLVLYGGLVAAFIGASVYIKIKGMPFYKIADLIMPYLALGQAFGRIGCYLNGCCFGKIAHNILGVFFPKNSIPYSAHFEKGLVSYDAQFSLPVYPVQLFSSLADILIFMLLIYIDKHKRREGETFWAFIIIYPLKRFFIEFLRGDNEIIFHDLTLYQIISIAVLVFGIAGYIIRKQKRDNSEGQGASSRGQV